MKKMKNQKIKMKILKMETKTQINKIHKIKVQKMEFLKIIFINQNLDLWERWVLVLIQKMKEMKIQIKKVLMKRRFVNL